MNKTTLFLLFVTIITPQVSFAMDPMERMPLLANASIQQQDSDISLDTELSELDTNLLRVIHYKGNDSLVKLLLELGANPNATYKNTTALMSAAAEGDSNTVQHLLNRGARVNQTFEGNTALIDAVRRNHIEVVRILLEAGANVAQKDLDIATRLGYVSITNILLEKTGANKAKQLFHRSVASQLNFWANVVETGLRIKQR